MIAIQPCCHLDLPQRAGNKRGNIEKKQNSSALQTEQTDCMSHFRPHLRLLLPFQRCDLPQENDCKRRQNWRNVPQLQWWKKLCLSGLHLVFLGTCQSLDREYSRHAPQLVKFMSDHSVLLSRLYCLQECKLCRFRTTQRSVHFGIKLQHTVGHRYVRSTDPIWSKYLWLEPKLGKLTWLNDTRPYWNFSISLNFVLGWAVITESSTFPWLTPCASIVLPIWMAQKCLVPKKAGLCPCQQQQHTSS